MLDRNLITQWLLDALADTDVPVGDHEAPKKGGWSHGEPNVESFQPYVILSAQGGTTAQGSLCPEFWDWRLSYQVRCHGVTRFSADQLCFRVIGALTGLPRTEFGLYRSNLVRVDAVGPVSKNHAANPPFWATQVNVSVDVVRTRNT